MYQSLEHNEWIAVDLGYRGLQHTFAHTAFPYPDKKVKLSENQKEFNREFKKVRIIVENVIMYIKKWKICQNTFRTYHSDLDQAQEEHHKVWLIAAGMVNQFTMPCRDYSVNTVVQE